MKWPRLIYRRNLIAEAKGLVSSGENPQYDRALVELITYASGGTQDEFLGVSEEIFGIERPDLWGPEANNGFDWRKG